MKGANARIPANTRKEIFDISNGILTGSSSFDCQMWPTKVINEQY